MSMNRTSNGGHHVVKKRTGQPRGGDRRATLSGLGPRNLSLSEWTEELGGNLCCTSTEKAILLKSPRTEAGAARAGARAD
jgi:hypothetical protein